MKKDVIRNDTRRKKRERRLGANAQCILCGERTPETLIRVQKSFLEEHHIAGKANDSKLTAPLCRNCHAKVHEDYRNNGVDLSADEDRAFLDTSVAFLEAAGTFHLRFGKSALNFSDELSLVIAVLDSEFPDWRDRVKEAKQDE